MHPKTLDYYEAARLRGLTEKHWPIKLMLSPHHFHASDGMHKAAYAISRHELMVGGAGSELTFPKGSRLPAPQMVLTVQHGDDVSVLLLHETEAGYVNVVLATEIRCFPMGSYKPGTSWHGAVLPENCSDEAMKAGLAATSVDEINLILWRTAFLVSLINEPRRVTVSPASGIDWTRPHRKRVQRLTGKAAMAYSTVSWQVGAGVKAKGNPGGDSDLKVALHWCRAHWRKAAPHMESAEWVTPRNRPAGWYLWISDCWKGHPDHGIKLQHHKPKMPDEKDRKGAAAPSGVRNATKLAAMSAQQRAALVQAGFAPSASLH